MKFDYKPTIEHVRGIHIGVVVAIILVVWLYMRGGLHGAIAAVPGVNGDGASTYVDARSVSGWKDLQYNSLGADAGALEGLSN